MAAYHGDIRLGDTIDIQFTTVQGTGAPTTLAGTPVISAYIGNSVTQLTAGITLTVDFDTVTGLNNVRVVATSGNGYATATNVSLVITTGTVNGVSVVGYCIGSFSIENRSAVMPTVAARTLDVAATGEAGVDYANVNLYAAGPFPPEGIVDSGTAQSATGTTLVLRAAAAFADSELIGATVIIRSATAGAGQRRLITANAGATDTVTVDTWTTTPTGTIVYDIFGSAPSSATSLPAVNATQFAGQTITAAAGVTLPSSVASPTNITAGTITTVTNLTNAPTAGDLTATMKTSVTTAATAATPIAASVTGAVGSVTAAVTVTGTPDVNVAKVNAVTLKGSGTAVDPWLPV